MFSNWNSEITRQAKSIGKVGFLKNRDKLSGVRVVSQSQNMQLGSGKPTLRLA